MTRPSYIDQQLPYNNRYATKSEQQAYEKKNKGSVAYGAFGAMHTAMDMRARMQKHLDAPSDKYWEEAWNPDSYKQSYQKPVDPKSLGGEQKPLSIHAFHYGGYETTALGQRRFALHHPKDVALYALYISNHPTQRPEFDAGKRPVLFRVVSASLKKVENGKEVEFAYIAKADTSRDTFELVGPWNSPLNDGVIYMDIGYAFSLDPGHPSRSVTIRVTPVFATAAQSKSYNKNLL